VAPGYDHITSAIGAALAGCRRLDALLVSGRHLTSDADDVRQGIIAYKIAAHAADVARRRPGRGTATTPSPGARYAFDWNLQSRSRSTPKRRGQARRDAPRRCLQTAEFCRHVRPEVLLDEDAQHLEDKSHPAVVERAPDQLVRSRWTSPAARWPHRKRRASAARPAGQEARGA